MTNSPDACINTAPSFDLLDNLAPSFDCSAPCTDQLKATAGCRGSPKTLDVCTRMSRPFLLLPAQAPNRKLLHEAHVDEHGGADRSSVSTRRDRPAAASHPSNPFGFRFCNSGLFNSGFQFQFLRRYSGFQWYQERKQNKSIRGTRKTAFAPWCCPRCCQLRYVLATTVALGLL